jgi:hypothetical protein
VSLVQDQRKYPVEFIRHCRWYAKHLKIVDPDGNVVPFHLRPVQKAIEYEFWLADQEKEPFFGIILKARRFGVSSLVAARNYREMKEFGNRRALIIAHDLPATKNILNNMVQFFWRNDSDPLKPKAEKESANSLKFEENESEFIVYTAGAREKAARSFAANSIHFSELDFFEDARVLPAAMQVTGNAWPTKVTIESTAAGPDGPMQREWDRAVEGISGFKPMFFAWFDDPRYTRELSFEDLIKFGPRAYVEQNRSYLLTCKREFDKEVDGHGLGRQSTRTYYAGRAGAGTEASGNGRGTDQGGEAIQPPALAEGEGPARREVGSGDGKRRKNPLKAGTKNRKALDAGLRKHLRDASGLGGVVVDESLLRKCYEAAFTSYEKSLLTEFDLTHEQINWMWWVKAVKCSGDETERRREYPSRAEEAFEAAAEAVLDPLVMAKWAKEAKENPPITVKFEIELQRDGSVVATAVEDNIGRVAIWEKPEEGAEYVMGVDPSSGLESSDWTVAVVDRLDTGTQVAEFRARMDPDMAIDQIEALGIYYNKAFTGVEANSIGLAYCRSLEDRGTLPMYERERKSSKEPNKKVKQIGWLTTGGSQGTREMLITELRKAVREDRCQIRSELTIREGRSLWVSRTANRLEKIEARPGTHDDGIFAHGIAIMMRNECLPYEFVEGERDLRDVTMDIEDVLPAEFLQYLQAQEKEHDRSSSLLPLPKTGTDDMDLEGYTLIGGRRSVL